MSKTEQVWHIAAKDSEHPLHEATWTLFTSGMRVKSAARRLENNKTAVINYMMTIIQTEELQYIGSFGSGVAPVNSVRLLGYWRVTKAIPYLIALLATEVEENSLLFDETMHALSNMGEYVIQPVIEFAERHPEERFAAAEILSKAGAKNDTAFQFIQKTFEMTDPKDWLDVDMASACLLRCDTERAVPYLKEKIKGRRLSRDSKDAIRANIDQVPNGLFDEHDLY